MKKYLFILLLILSNTCFSENYAILISGNLDPDESSIEQVYMAPDTAILDEFWNDLYLTWETLYLLGFKNENIFVFYQDGIGVSPSDDRYDSDEYYDIGDIVDYDATRSSIIALLSTLPIGAPNEGIPQLTENDFLFIWTFGHGKETSSDTALVVRDSSITDAELDSYLDDIPFDKRVIWMQQCYAGGFIDDLSDNSTVIVTSCEPDEQSYRADNTNPDGSDARENEILVNDTYHHGEFNYHSLNAVNLETIVGNSLSSPDKNSDSKTSIQELYDWADSTESSKTQHSNANVIYGPQHPQIDDAGNNASSVFIDVDPPEVTISGSVVSEQSKISWSEPSGILDIEEYEVWRYRTASGGGYTLRATVMGTTYTDNSIVVVKIPPNNRVYYKVKVVDDAGNKSGYSNIEWFYDSSTSKLIAIGNNDTNLPTIFELKQNYPNPFNPETKIQFDIPEDSNVKLKIFNVQGQIVATLFDGALAAGFHTATFDATSFTSGVYFYKIVAGNFTDTKRMLLVK